jgi:membrane dipeptidase
MPYSTEQDPLLPKDEPAPEIHGSRPQSINNVYIVNTEVVEVPDNNVEPRRSINDLVAMIFGLCLFLSLVLTFLPADFFDGLLGKPAPLTVEQRVNKILTDTPLIGTLSSVLI